MRLDLFDHAGNLVYVAAYLVKDILWLRILAIVGSLIILPYYLLRDQPLWVPVCWAFVFIAINGFRAFQVYRERRPATLSEEEEALYNVAFGDLTTQQFKRLCEAGHWRDLEAGQTLQSTGDPANRITALASGELEVSRHGRLLGSFGPGDLLGIACLYESPRSHFHEMLDTRVAAPSRVLQWDSEDIRKVTGGDPDFDKALSKLVASSLVLKLISFIDPVEQPG